MSPAALSTVLVTFADDEHQRRRALGFWSMTATGGAAVGLLLGGILTQYASWRWNFFINVPVGIITAILIARLVPRHGPAGHDRHLDLPGAVLVTAGLMAAVLAFSQAPAWGWGDPRTLGGLATAIAAIAGFIVNEQRTTRPLMPLSIFRVRNAAGANAMMAAVYSGNLAMFFLLTLYLQDIEGYSAIGTGLAFLPFPVVLGFMSTRMAGLMARSGFRPFLILGPAAVTGSLHGTAPAQALTTGYNAGMAVAAGLTLLALLLAVTVIRSPQPSPAPRQPVLAREQ